MPCFFKINIVVVSNELVFEPSFDNFKESLCDILDKICNAVRNFARLETQLFLDWAGPTEFLQVPHCQTRKIYELINVSFVY